jgi:ATP synthase protein I
MPVSGKGATVADQDKPGDLAALDARIKAARAERGEPEQDGAQGKASMSGAGFALRAGIEMVACLGVGAGLGYLLDDWLGTRPWLLALFFLLGGAAGVMTVLQLAGRMQMPGDTEGNKRS